MRNGAFSCYCARKSSTPDISMNADVTTNYFVRSELVAARGVNSVLKKHIVPAAHSPPGAAESGERTTPGVSVFLSEAEAAKVRIDEAGE